jgi:hypothetical protein
MAIESEKSTYMFGAIITNRICTKKGFEKAPNIRKLIKKAKERNKEGRKEERK